MRDDVSQSSLSLFLSLLHLGKPAGFFPIKLHVKKNVVMLKRKAFLPRNPNLEAKKSSETQFDNIFGDQGTQGTTGLGLVHFYTYTLKT